MCVFVSNRSHLCAYYTMLVKISYLKKKKKTLRFPFLRSSKFEPTQVYRSVVH